MRDPNTEQFLTKRGYKFRFVEKLPLAEIDLVEAKENTARPFRKLDDATALKYCYAMEAGDEFPAIVVIERTDSKRLWLATGLHRIEAAGLCKTPITALDAYVVEEDDSARITLLIHSLNIIIGKAPEEHENLLLAAESKLLHPHLTNKEIAATFNMKEPTLASFLRQQDGERRSIRLGIEPYFCSLKNQSLKLGLDRLQSDNAFSRAVIFAANYRLLGSDADVFVSDILKCRSEAAVNDMIDKREELIRKREAEAGAKWKHPARAKWSVLLTRCKIILRGDDVPALGLTSVPDEKLQETMTVFEETMDRLNRTLRVLKLRVEQITRRKTAS